MFIGEYHHNIDEKNRIIIPSKFRNELGDEVIITRGLENCLFLYPKSNWDKITNKLSMLPFTKKDARSFNRFFLSGATSATFDKQGRVNLSSVLKDYADLTKECVVIGVGDRLEIWSLDKWNEFYATNEENMSDIAENLFDKDLDI